MTLTLIFAVVALLLLLALLWTVHETRLPRSVQTGRVPPALEDLFPLHCRYFPQIQQALSQSDAEYLRHRASGQTRRKALKERRTIAREFLVGLREDFRRIDQLGRTIAALSPEVHHVQEVERIRLSLRFEVLYLRMQLQIAWGGISVPVLKRLTDLVGAQAAQMEAAMTALQELSLRTTGSNFSV